VTLPLMRGPSPVCGADRVLHLLGWTQEMLQYRMGSGFWPCKVAQCKGVSDSGHSRPPPWVPRPMGCPSPRKPDLHGFHLFAVAGERGTGGVETSPPNDRAPPPVTSNLTFVWRQGTEATAVAAAGRRGTSNRRGKCHYNLQISIASLNGGQLRLKLFDLILEDPNPVLLFLPSRHWVNYIGIEVGNQVSRIFISKDRKN
jgi:hypothetical protein